MRFSQKLGMTAMMAAFFLASAVGTANAGRLSISNQRFRVTWTALTFTEIELGVSVSCQVTLEGSFHSATIPKRERLLVGAITRVHVREAGCTGGIALINNATLPWHVTYESFNGTLPNPTAVNLLLSRFQFIIEVGLGLCKYGTASDNITGAAALVAREVTTLTPVGGRNIAHRVEGVFCPETGSLTGAGNVTLLNSTTRIRVTLI
jgi:hypothetical protein